MGRWRNWHTRYTQDVVYCEFDSRPPYQGGVENWVYRFDLKSEVFVSPNLTTATKIMYNSSMDDWQKLIYARWQNMPDGYTFCMDKDYTKAEILEHIKAKDEVYETILRCEQEYFAALKSGELAKFVREEQ